MCGRYTLRTPLTVLSQQFLFELGDLPAGFDLPPRPNIAPTQMVSVVRRSKLDAPRLLAMLRWGLIPSWAKDAKIASRMINARSETLAEKPSFRTAFARRRCLVLADGYYEWLTEGKRKTPYLFCRSDEQPFALAGLWESWRVPPGDPLERLAQATSDSHSRLESVTIVTAEANELAAPIHDRMPVILAPEQYDLWLDPAITDPKRLMPLLRPSSGPDPRDWQTGPTSLI